MKLSHLSILGVAAAATPSSAAMIRQEASNAPHRFRPTKISFAALQAQDSQDAALWDALTTVGMVSITSIPGFYKHHHKTLTSLIPCLNESPPAATQEQELPDGTRRRTIATHSVPGGMQELHLEGRACDTFSDASRQFRRQVASVTQVFSQRLASLLSSESSSTAPVLITHEGFAFDTMVEVVENGDHLEHFHSYETSVAAEEEKTIEWHTDQGLFIAFTPGLMIHQQDPKRTRLSDGFAILHKDGSQAMVEFQQDDELIIMLGDGIKQLVGDDSSNHPLASLRATPHALKLPAHSQDEARNWYGRMVLPPSSAIHPKHNASFGSLRERLVNHKPTAVHLGCSTTTTRRLETTLCEDEGTIRCWHRCMSLAEYETSVETCAQQSLDLACTNPRRQLSSGEAHGDFFPRLY